MSELLKLLMGHALSDFALQSPWMAQAKNRNRPAPEPPPGQTPQTVWPYVLTSHALIHGAAVYVITGSELFGLLETVAHWLIDFGKCENKYGIHVDQGLHVVCKIIWWIA